METKAPDEGWPGLDREYAEYLRNRREQAMAIRVVRLGTPHVEGEGLRLGTVRRPPRGMPKAEFAARDCYDVWLQELAPSELLVKTAQGAPARSGPLDEGASASTVFPAFPQGPSTGLPPCEEVRNVRRIVFGDHGYRESHPRQDHPERGISRQPLLFGLR